MNNHFSEACDSVDACIFSGDALYSDKGLAEFKEYIARWQCLVQEHESKNHETDTKIKPLSCPFCGERDPVLHPNDLATESRQMGIPGTDPFYVHCDCCGCDGPVMPDEHSSVEHWNKAAETVEAVIQKEQAKQKFDLDHTSELLTISEAANKELRVKLQMVDEALDAFLIAYDVAHKNYEQQMAARFRLEELREVRTKIKETT